MRTPGGTPVCTPGGTPLTGRLGSAPNRATLVHHDHHHRPRKAIDTTESSRSTTADAEGSWLSVRRRGVRHGRVWVRDTFCRSSAGPRPVVAQAPNRQRINLSLRHPFAAFVNPLCRRGGPAVRCDRRLDVCMRFDGWPYEASRAPHVTQPLGRRLPTVIITCSHPEEPVGPRTPQLRISTPKSTAVTKP